MERHRRITGLPVSIKTNLQRTPFYFRTMATGGLWLTAFGNIELNIAMADEMDIKKTETQDVIKIILADAYNLRDEWGDTHFPIKTMRWVRKMERHFEMPQSERLSI